MLRIVFFLLITLLSISSYASNQDKNESRKYAALVVNAENGKILHQENANQYRNPASLTKMMTLYLAFIALDNKTIKLDDKIYVSSYAASMPRTNLNLNSGDYIKVKEAILGMIIHSANDAAVALAEHLSGSEKVFAEIMTNQAKALGMHKTVFKNASGLHDRQQKTTALDLAKLSIALKKHFPHYYKFFSMTKFDFNGTTYISHNHIKKKYNWTDGLKTGYTSASGFNLATSANVGGTKLVGIILGERTAKARDNKMVELLSLAFNREHKIPAKIKMKKA